MGTLLALYWSLPSVYTSSVARAYCRPFLGLEGAGEGGKSWPSRSRFVTALWRALSLLSKAPAAGAAEEEPESDIATKARFKEEAQARRLATWRSVCSMTYEALARLSSRSLWIVYSQMGRGSHRQSHRYTDLGWSICRNSG